MKKLLNVFILFITFFFIVGSSNANQEKALAWLASNQDANTGSIYLESDDANIDQSTEEAVRALAGTVASDNQNIVANAAEYLDTYSLETSSTENLSRRIILKLLAKQSISAATQELLLRRNVHGGFGSYRNAYSDILSTSFVLSAMAKSGAVVDSSDINYLVNAQNVDGSWSFPVLSESNVELTAYVLDALWRYRNQYNLTPVLDAAQSFLEGQVIGDLWGSTEQSVLALVALAQRTIDRSSFQTSIDGLVAQQLANGSFENDVYLTALIARLLQVLEVQAEDAIVVAGSVIDADSGAALSSVTVALDGPEQIQTSTALDGTFLLSPTAAGMYSMSVSLDGYSQLLLQTTLVEGNQLELGELALNKLTTNLNSTVRGTVKSRLSNTPLAGVLVSISEQPALNATTNTLGEYQITNVPAGSIDITASLSGYQSASGSAELAQQQTLIFSPLLAEITTADVTVSGIVTDSSTTLPLENVAVMVTSNGDQFEAMTSVDGSYQITDIPSGLIQVTANFAGYTSLSGSVDAPDGANINFSPQMTLEGEPPVVDTGALKALVIDAATGRGLSNVDVVITYISSGQVLPYQTDQDGYIEISDLDVGGVSVVFQLTEYEAISMNVEIQPAIGIDLGTITLTPILSQNSANLIGQVINVRTSEPIQNVIISLSNNGTIFQEVLTSAGGIFEFAMVALTDVDMSIASPDYVDTSFTVNIDTVGEFDLGQIRLRPNEVVDLLPDLAVVAIDTSQINSNDETFEVTGLVKVDLSNKGNSIVASGYNVTAFDDVNNNGLFDDGDVTLAVVVVNEELGVDSTVQVTLDIIGTQRFRDAPISVFVDSSNFIAELSEDNNIDKSKEACAGQSVVSVDLALCMDASGSVSRSDFNLQLEGTARAIENPEIVARDGSVRLTAIQFSNNSRVELSPTVVTEGNIQDVVNTIRTIRKLGGGTSIHNCIFTAAQQLSNVNMVLPSLVQVIDVSTDGQSSISLAVQASNNAQSAGVDVLNSIGVGGGVNLNLLNSIVFPQPSGGERGFVQTASSYQEYIDAISVKIAKETKLVDLTVGQLRMIEGGTLINLSVVIGNSGSGDITESITIRFFNGDPSQGGVEIGFVQYANGLVSGGSAIVELQGLAADLINADTLFARGEFTEIVSECADSNNETSTAVKSNDGIIDLVLDKSQYGLNELVDLSSEVINIGLFTGEYTVDTIISDAFGNEIVRFKNQPTGELLASASTAVMNSWNVGDIFVGSYIAESLLFNSNGDLIDQDQESFTIVSDVQTSVLLRTTTDRLVYHTSDLVEIDDLVRNIATNALEPNTSLEIRVFAPDGSIIYAKSRHVGDLSPAFSNSYINLLALDGATEGNYTVRGSVLSSSGEILASDTALFSVSNDLTLSISGSVEVSVKELYQGESLVCTDTINNTGSETIVDILVRQIVVNMDTSDLVLSDEFAQGLDVGEINTMERTIDTTNFELGNYSCALQTFVSDEWVNLDADFFEVIEPPIKITLEANFGTKGRLLILLDDATQCTDEPYGPYNAPNLVEQRALLESVLDEAGWSYTITQNISDFMQELRTGGYSTYLLMSELTHIDHFAQKEIREAVYRGDGLIEAGKQNFPYVVVNEALGILHRGVSLHLNGVSLTDSQLSSADNVTFTHRDKNVQIMAHTAEVVADYLSSRSGYPYHSQSSTTVEDQSQQSMYGGGYQGYKGYKDHQGKHYHGKKRYSRYDPKACPPKHQNKPAITINDYGLGKSVFIGFDLMMEATSLGAQESIFTELLLNALGFVNPEPLSTAAGTDTPIIFTIQNQGVATPARLVLPVPDGVSVVDAGEGQVDEATQSIIWTFDLADGQTLDIALWVEMPAQVTTLTAMVDSGESPNFIEQATTSVELVPAAMVSLTELIDITATSYYLHAVKNQLRHAQRQLSRGKPHQALNALLIATSHVGTMQQWVDDEALHDLRVQIDWVIKQVAKTLITNPQQPRHRCVMRGHKKPKYRPHPRHCGHGHHSGHYDATNDAQGLNSPDELDELSWRDLVESQSTQEQEPLKGQD